MLVRVLFPGDTSSKTVTEPGTHMGSNQLLVENSSTHETKNHPTKNALSQKNMILHWYFRGFFFDFFPSISINIFCGNTSCLGGSMATN